jgi:hypothetical protein
LLLIILEIKIIIIETNLQNKWLGCRVVPPEAPDTWRHVPWETQEEGLGFALLLTNHSRGCVLNSQNLVIEYQRSTHTSPA